MYLYDDHFTLIINASKKPVSIDDIPLEEIEEAFNTDKTCTEQCSTMTSPAPPEQKQGTLAVPCFCSQQTKRRWGGIEGERARRRRVKTLRGSVFSERADETLPIALNPTDEMEGCER